MINASGAVASPFFITLNCGLLRSLQSNEMQRMHASEEIVSAITEALSFAISNSSSKRPISVEVTTLSIFFLKCGIDSYSILK